MNSSRRKSQGRFVSDFLTRSWRAEQAAVSNSPTDLELLTQLLYNSSGTGLAWWRIHESDLSTTTSGQLLHQGYRLQALQSAIQEERIVIAFRILRAAGIEPILVKGWAAARAYAHRTLRPYGDIDLVVRPAEFAAARAALAGSETPTWWVDLHQQLVELDDRSIDDLFKRSRTEDLKGVPIRILSHEDHLALLAMHYFKHSAWRVAGLCDIAAVVESLPAEFDWKVCLGSGRHRRAWIASAIVLAHRLLGADVDRTPLELRSHQLPGWLLDTVLLKWGSFLPSDDSMPGQPRPLFGYGVRSLRTLLHEIVSRWPDPILATFNLRAQPNNWPRLPYQVGAFTARIGHYLFQHRRPAS